jgi:membrane associated rhomboid family serine protease
MFKPPELKIFKRGTYITLSFILLIWTIKSIEWAKGVDFGSLGILPRTLKGSIGIVTGPLIHGDFIHLMSNTFPLIILCLGLFYFYHKIAMEVFIWIYLATGFWVWIIGRDAYHIGASGIVYGLVMFIFWGGILRRDSRSLAISMIIFFLYGYMVYGLIPGEGSVSWESHLMGSIAGIFLAVYFRKTPIYVGEVDTGIVEDSGTKIDYQNVNKNKIYNHTSSDPVQFHYTYKPKSKKKA